MPRHKVEGESEETAAYRDDQLVERAAKRADWAGSALEGAADDLEDVGDGEDALTGLAEVVQDEAERVSRLAKDIESQRTDMDAKPAAGDGGPFLAIGDVSVWALGEHRFRIESPAGTEEIEGFGEARRRARELAGEA